jgi:DegV family protein with EDD domain
MCYSCLNKSKKYGQIKNKSLFNRSVVEMPVKIVTDSTCDIPGALTGQYHITVIPLYINIGTEELLDGIDISRPDFYSRLPDLKPPPTTAAPGIEKFRQTYESLADTDNTEILSIHVSEALSSTVTNARLAAKQVEKTRVEVLDSRQLSLGTGLLVLTAARLAAEGKNLEEILPALEEQIKRTHLFAALDTLEYLRRSGRVNAIAAGLGSILQIIPLLKMYDGVPDSERIRTRKRAQRRLVELLEAVSPLSQVALIHTNAPEHAEQLRQEAARLFPPGELVSTIVTPVIGTHIGPGAAGFVAISAYD